MSLHIGMTCPDKALDESAFSSGLTGIAARLATQRAAQLAAGGPDIDLRFLLPGKHETPAFEGMRFTAWREDEAVLYVESAVPASLIHSVHAEQYIVAALQDAIDNAAGFFAETGIAFNQAVWLQLVETHSLSAESPCLH